MLLVRSMMTTRSSGTVGAAPHGPRHAAEVTIWVVPLVTPTAGPKRNGTVAVEVRTMVLQVSPSAGTHGATHTPALQTHAPKTLGPGLHTDGTSLASKTPLLSRSPTRHR